MKKESVKKIIGEAIGEASLLWSPFPKGVFLSNKGSELIDRIVRLVEESLNTRSVTKGSI